MTQIRAPRLFLSGLLLSAAAAASSAQTNDSVPPQRVAARASFRDAKLGLFIHWGVYSQLGQGEWVMENRGIPVDTYEWLASAFNPVQFDAHRLGVARQGRRRQVHHDHRPSP